MQPAAVKKEIPDLPPFINGDPSCEKFGNVEYQTKHEKILKNIPDFIVLC